MSATSNSAWIPTAQVYSAQLPAGNYGFQVMSGVGAPFGFTVDAAGNVDYDAAHPFLAGRGTSTLTVAGLPMSIDATRLWGGPRVFRNVVDATPLTSGPLRLLPGPHQFVYGSGQSSQVTVTVTDTGTFQYPAVLDTRSDGCLSGRGTAALTLLGYPLARWRTSLASSAG